MNNVLAEAYREEAGELLGVLEVSLLQLEERPSDEELVASVFRALHTIKGSGAMFGFDAIAGFAHEVETVFERVRDGRTPVTAELVGITLAARDHIQQLLAEAGRESEELRAAGAAILNRLGQAARSETGSEAVPAKFEPEPAVSRLYRIHFEPGVHILETGTNPILLIRELAELGELDMVADLGNIPPLQDLEPTQCHVSWDFKLRTAAGENAIRDVFIFVEDQARIVIEPVNESPEAAGAAGRDPVDDASIEQRHQPALQEKRRPSESAATLRVPAAKLDQLVNVVGELVTVQARLSGFALGFDDPEMTAIAEEVERLTEILRENTMNIRMLPIGETFTRFKRLVRDLSAELGKRVDLATEGDETELDKTVIEQLGDSILHLVRNSVDHGIEPPDVRVALGKPPAGRLLLEASHAGAFVLISVSDDGAGLDRAAIRQRAVERGVIPADAVLADSELDALIFEPGFSTARSITGVSGRGVGMDVVKRSVEGLRGDLSVSSVPGKGTRVTLRIPLTLAIIEGLLVEAGGSYFVLPLSNVSECIEMPRRHPGSRSDLVTVRNEQIPYIALRERFSIDGDLPPIEQVIIAETGDGRFGFVVDRVIGDHHAVIKKLGALYRHVEEISGATILGSGEVALVLDVGRMAAAAIRERAHRPHLVHA